MDEEVLLKEACRMQVMLNSQSLGLPVDITVTILL